MKSYKLLFFISMILSSLIAISSYSWFSMWLGLEINLLSIIPLFNSTKNFFPAEASLKYFITQSMASSIILFSILNIINNSSMMIMDNFSNEMIFNSAILTKMGAAPFHYWFPEIMEGLNWLNCLILLSWQKLTPLMIISYNISISYFFLMIIISSTILGSIMSINQISLRKILAFSSINHLAWMISSLLFSNSIWLIYFSVYSFISMILIYLFNKINLMYFYQILNYENKSKNMNMFLFLTFFSLGGLPPFLGFLPKWFTIYSMFLLNLNFLIIILIMMTLILLFVYLRMTFNSLILTINNSKFKNQIKLSNFLMICHFLNLIGLVICPLSVYFF